MRSPLTSPMALALLTPSARVLAAAARPGGVEPHALPWDEVHWPTLVSLMVYERAESQVWELLRRVPDRVPEDVRGAVQGMARVARFRAAALSDAVAEAVDVLEASAVPVLWLKGAALAMQRAEGFSVRGMGDADLLVAPADQARARTALSAAGWTTPAVQGYERHHHDAPCSRALTAAPACTPLPSPPSSPRRALAGHPYPAAAINAQQHSSTAHPPANMWGVVAYRYALLTSSQALVRISLLLRVEGLPLQPSHRSCRMGWSMMPSTGTPSSSSAIRVPKRGLPAPGGGRGVTSGWVCSCCWWGWGELLA